MDEASVAKESEKIIILIARRSYFRGFSDDDSVAER